MLLINTVFIFTYPRLPFNCYCWFVYYCYEQHHKFNISENYYSFLFIGKVNQVLIFGYHLQKILIVEKLIPFNYLVLVSFKLFSFGHHVLLIIWDSEPLLTVLRMPCTLYIYQVFVTQLAVTVEIIVRNILDVS